jgi:hypothetical protein
MVTSLRLDTIRGERRGGEGTEGMIYHQDTENTEFRNKIGNFENQKVQSGAVLKISLSPCSLGLAGGK